MTRFFVIHFVIIGVSVSLILARKKNQSFILYINKKGCILYIVTIRCTIPTDTGDGAPKSSNIVSKLFLSMSQSDGI
jgi:hypothetical protein